MRGKKRNNIIALGLTGVLLAACLMISQYQVNDVPKLTVTYTYEDKSFMKPSGKTISRNILLDTRASNTEIETLINKEVSTMDAPNVFVYVYNPGTEVKTGIEWAAMYSSEYGIQFKN